MPDQRSCGERLVFGREHGPRAEREEKVLRYVVHRRDEEAHLHDVLREAYVRRHCTQEEVDESSETPSLSMPAGNTWSGRSDRASSTREPTGSRDV
jgi:hypothetical protein